jgi:hypothetical protein
MFRLHRNVDWMYLRLSPIDNSAQGQIHGKYFEVKWVKRTIIVDITLIWSLGKYTFCKWIEISKTRLQMYMIQNWTNKVTRMSNLSNLAILIYNMVKRSAPNWINSNCDTNTLSIDIFDIRTNWMASNQHQWLNIRSKN